MNVEEGHLGGYIRSRHSARPTRFALEHGDPQTYCPALWQWCIDELRVSSVLDVGCGEGHAARWFRDRGARVLGVDGSREALRDSRVPDRQILHDFNDGPFVSAERFDLVWCSELVEHVEARFEANVLRSFEAGQHFVLMTYAPPGQPGHHHVNCQPEGYWVERIEALGYRLDERATREARAVAGHGHFEARGLVFER